MLKDQLRDYQYRGDALEEMNFLDYMLNTYEGKKSTYEDNNEEEANEGEPRESNAKKGRPPNARIPYQDEAKKGGSCRIMRTQGHETLPRFVGKWFSRNDCKYQQEIDTYHASMLMLLKPWRKLYNLKEENETFKTNFDKMLQTAGKRTLTVIENIQYFHECSDGAKARREQERQGIGKAVECELMVEESEMLEFEQRDRRGEEEDHDVTEEDINAAKITRIPQRERIFGELAIIEAYDAGIFHDIYPDASPWREPARVVEGINELLIIKAWEKQLKETTRNQVKEQGTIDLMTRTARKDKDPKTRELGKEKEPVIERESAETQQQGTEKQRKKLSMLNTEQRRAHDMVEKRLIDYITSE